MGWRSQDDITLPVADYVGRARHRLQWQRVARIDAAADTVVAGDGSAIPYDYLLICTGPKLAFEEVPGTGPENGHTQSVCTTAHAQRAWTPTGNSCGIRVRS